jgi:hypothetical protein
MITRVFTQPQVFTVLQGVPIRMGAPFDQAMGINVILHKSLPALACGIDFPSGRQVKCGIHTMAC